MIVKVTSGLTFPHGTPVRVVKEYNSETWVVLSDNREQLVPKADVTLTLEAMGTPWAETYAGSGRLTGRLEESPTTDAQGRVAPWWMWVGHWTMAEFDEAFTTMTPGAI